MTLVDVPTGCPNKTTKNTYFLSVGSKELSNSRILMPCKKLLACKVIRPKALLLDRVIRIIASEF